MVAATFVWTVALDPQAGIVNAWGTRLLGWDEPVPFLSTAHGQLFGVPVPTAKTRLRTGLAKLQLALIKESAE